MKDWHNVSDCRLMTGALSENEVEVVTFTPTLDELLGHCEATHNRFQVQGSPL